MSQTICSHIEVAAITMTILIIILIPSFITYIESTSEGMQVGNIPTGIAVNPTTNKVYVTNLLSNTVSVIDGSSGMVSKNITVGSNPFGIAVNPTTNKVYVTNIFYNHLVNANINVISVIDGSSDKIISNIVTNEKNFGISVNPNNNKIYIANADSNTVSIIDANSNKLVSSINLNDSPIGIAVNPNSNRVYAITKNFDVLYMINGNTLKLFAAIPLGENPIGIAFNPSSNLIYATSISSNSIVTVNGTTNNLVAGLTFVIDPPNSGYISCDKTKISSIQFKFYSVNSHLNCQAGANEWYKFERWEGLSSVTNANTVFEISNTGLLKAVFSPFIPTLYWIILLTIIIPEAVVLIISRIHKFNLNKQIIEIDSIYNRLNHEKNKCIDELGQKKKFIIEGFLQNKIRVPDYIRLDVLISHYLKKVNEQ